MGLDLKSLCMRKIKGTSYKLVLSGWTVIGIFEGKQFYSAKNMNKAQKDASEKWHASTFKERLENPVGAG